MQPRERKLYRFEDFELDAERRRLSRGSSPVAIPARAFDLLVLFVARPMELLERDFLLSQIWSDRHVGEANLSVTVSNLRKLLGDTGADRRLIETVPTRGYRFIAEVVEERATIETPVVERADPESNVVAPAPRWNWQPFLATSLSLLAIAAVVLAAYRVTGVRASSTSLITASLRPLTNAPGYFSQPVFSPDGEQLAYSWDQGADNASGIYRQHVTGDNPVAVTSDDGLHYAPAWSPDGQRIAYLRCRTLSEPMTLRVAGVNAAGAPRELAQVAPYLSSRSSPAGPPSLDWSGDGKLLVTSDLRDTELSRPLVLISAETGQRRFLTRPAAYGEDSFGRFSPNGRLIAFRRRFAASAEDVFLVDRETGAERRITWDRKTVCGVSWSEDGESLIVCSLRGGGYGNLWRFYLDQRRPEHLSPIRFGAKMPVAARRGGRLAYISAASDDNVWSIPANGTGAAKKLIASTFLDSSPHYSPSGNAIAFRSTRTGNNEIWICGPSGENARRLTRFDGPMVGSPRWAPDGQSIAFDSRGKGTSDIYTIDPRTGRTDRLTSGDADEEVPNWSHDGKWIYYSSNRTGRFEIWKKPRGGGPEIQVTRDGAFNGIESADGSYLYYVGDLALTSIVRFELATGRSETVIPALGAGMWGYWTPFGRDILFLRRERDGGAVLHRYSGGAVVPASQGANRYSPGLDDKGLDLSPDGKVLLFTQREYERSVIMIADNFR